MQEPILFNRSIKDNIKYGNFDATDEQVYKAALIANAVEFIESSSKEALTKQQRIDKINKDLNDKLQTLMYNYPEIYSLKDNEWETKQKDLILNVLRYSDGVVLELIEAKIDLFKEMINEYGNKDGTKWDDIIIRLEWHQDYENMVLKYNEYVTMIAILDKAK